MNKAKRKPRLKKNPEISDYVVESHLDIGSDGVETLFKYFLTRAAARAYAKECLYNDCHRVRVFHMKFTLVSDVKIK